ncbi:MAG: HlyD family type I secretion periplasmic adaptor subunit [Alphaproteobacteria bacterium]|nr:HlyD family type I secretion periplasmic adaptor subunit [Alphaproteobacteria bacterium]OJV45215.1 MAG: hypothetical protein BGO28_00220 [Alphaproteobacteria bacterium 43-37]
MCKVADYLVHNLKTLKDHFQSLFHIQEEIDQDLDTEAQLWRYAWPAVRVCLVIIGIGVGFFIIWGGLAPLDSAAVAQGKIILSQNHKVIQHLEGGIIKEILVQDGDHAEKGQSLIILDDTETRSHLNIVLAKARYYLANEKRILAEQEENIALISPDNDLLKAGDPDVEQILESQKIVFRSNHKLLQGKASVFEKRIAQYQQNILAYEATLEALETTKQAQQEILSAHEALMKKGVVPKLHVLERKNAYFQTIGKIKETRALIVQEKEKIIEQEELKVNTKKETLSKLAEEFKQNHLVLMTQLQEYQNIQDILARKIIRSSTAGVINSLSYHTIGGIIPPNGRILEIIPENDRLLVEAMVDAKDIDSIEIGSMVKIQLEAFKNFIVPRVSGKIIYLSGDRIEAASSPMSIQDSIELSRPSYLVRVEIDQKCLENINARVKLYPGMPATVFIIKGSRTFLQYLISPLLDSFHRSFKET